MSDMFALLGRLTVIVIGFVAALAAGGLFFTLALTGVMEPNSGASLSEHWLTVIPLAMFVAATSGALIVIPFFAAAGLCEYFALRGFALHLAAGAAIGLLAIWYREGAGVAALGKPVTAAIAAGAVAGSVYWLIAGRNAGKTFGRIVSGSPSSGS